MAKMLISSIFRSGYSGRVVAFTNSAHKLYEYGRLGLKEHTLPITVPTNSTTWPASSRIKHCIDEYLTVADYDTVMFLNYDCLCLKNPEPLFRDGLDIGFAVKPAIGITNDEFNAYLTQHEIEHLSRPAMNAGVWWIRGKYVSEVLTQWTSIDAERPQRRKVGGSQPAWNRVLLDTKLRAAPLDLVSAVRYPLSERRSEREFQAAYLTQYDGHQVTENLAHMMGAYIRRFHSDSCYSLLRLLDG